MRRALITAICGFLAGCGYVGDPKPPSLDIPSRITDLRAIQYGDKILAAFTVPQLTTEGVTLTAVRGVELRASAAGLERAFPVPPKDPGQFEYEFPAGEWSGKRVTLAARATGPKGKASEWSNEAVLSVGPPLAVPSSVSVENARRGVRLTWQGAAPGYRVFRIVGEQAPSPAGDSTEPEYTDVSAELGTRYRYFVVALEGETRQSEASGAVEITPRDVFAPAVPAGVSAVAAVDSIELSWERNTEDDLAGYNIYRSVDAGAFERLAGPIEAPAYGDRTIETARRYRYTVTSVDTAGNESARSMVAEVTAQ